MSIPTLSTVRLLVAACFLLATATFGPCKAADDDQALGLQADARTGEAPAPMRIFVEAAAGLSRTRSGSNESTGRASLDLRGSAKATSSLSMMLSARVDALDPPDPRVDNQVLSLRELYLSWRDDSSRLVLDAGRINVRQGPGFGYNPTDYFRDRALRTITTADPFQLRENRLGSVMLRGTSLFGDSSFELVYSPKLVNMSSTRGMSADLGATNARDRGMAALNTRWSEQLNTQLSVYKETETPVKVGASATVLLSRAVVAYGEWSAGRERDLLSRALGPSGTESVRSRMSAGLTYTTESRLSLTAEMEQNGAALDRDGWQRLPAYGPLLATLYFLEAARQQDNPGRRAVLLHAVQRDLATKNLDLTVIVRRNLADRSCMVWADLKYRLDRFDVALQFQMNSGELLSEFGLVPARRRLNLVTTVYF